MRDEQKKTVGDTLRTVGVNVDTQIESVRLKRFEHNGKLSLSFISFSSQHQSTCLLFISTSHQIHITCIHRLLANLCPAPPLFSIFLLPISVWRRVPTQNAAYPYTPEMLSDPESFFGFILGKKASEVPCVFKMIMTIQQN